ncbi:MAG: GNAT family N-acetyltransferase [Methanomassiliicoccales archaeon]|jgi:ribosomal protein S18 acetylase RimI-like enzyme
MTRRDIPALVRMSRENMAHIVLSSWGTEWRDDTLVRAVTDPDTVTEIATHDERIVGYYTFFKRIDSVFIVSIQILRQYQQRGLGSLMMARIEEWGRRNGLDAVELWVQSTNESAISFYEHVGYRVAGKQGNNYLMSKVIKEKPEASVRGCHVGTSA